MLQRVCKECLSELDWTYGNKDFFAGYEKAFCLECDEKRSEWFVWDSVKNRIIDEGQQEPEWLAEKQPWEQSTKFMGCDYLIGDPNTHGQNKVGHSSYSRNNKLLDFIKEPSE